MRFFKWFFREINFTTQCRKYGVSMWECPQFIFIVMGCLIVAAMLATFYIGTRYAGDPQIAALIVMGVTGALLIVGYSITQGFEKLAEAARMKTEFVSIVSHELRSPLSNLKWSTEFLQSGRAGVLSEKQEDYVSGVQENTERMISLVTDLLKVSQIDQRAIPLDLKKFSMADIVQKVITGLNGYANAHNAVFEVSAAPNLPMAFGDPEKVRWVLESLVDNAIRYSSGKSTVWITVEQWGDKVRCVIKDGGMGIPPTEHKYVFKKFFRSKSTLRYATEGFGLALYIAKGFIEKMGGKIGFTSRPNKGSTFWFTLPTAKLTQNKTQN